MPKASKESLQALLASRGLKFGVAGGKLIIRECIGPGLPPKMATLVFVAKMKPSGSVGRGPPQGFNLQTAMGLSDAHYKVFREASWIILQRTNEINVKKSFTQQVPGSIDLCMRKLLQVHPELEAYELFGNWAPLAMFQLLLRNKSGQANSAVNKMEKLAALIAAGEVPPEPAIKPRKPRGRPRKSPVPAPEGTTTTTNQPAAPIQPSLMPGPIAAASQVDDGEVFDLNVGGADDWDTSMHSTIHELSKFSINPDAPDQDKGEGEGEGEEDGGSFDMAQVAPVLASTPAPTPNTVPVLTTPAVLSAVSPLPVVSAAPMRTSAPPASAPPARPTSLPAPASPAADASTTPPVLPAPAVSAAPPFSPAHAASSAPKPPPVPISPVNAASAAPPVHTVPLANSSDSAPAPIIWRGLWITPDDMAKLKKTAARRAGGGKDRFAKIYEELIEKLIEDPGYDPSSEPDPVPRVAAKKAAPKAKPAPTPQPGPELNPNAGKGKGKAVVEATGAPARRSARESKQTKWYM